MSFHSVDFTIRATSGGFVKLLQGFTKGIELEHEPDDRSENKRQPKLPDYARHKAILGCHSEART